MSVYAVILAGGSGSRLGSDIPKQFLKLGDGAPIIAHSMLAFENIPEIKGIVLVAHPEYENDIIDISAKYNITKFIKIVPGGKTRTDSSFCGITALKFQNDDILLIHDAARPFVNRETIIDTIEKTKINGAAGAYVHSSDTITVIQNGEIKEIPDRTNLYKAQTPQGFMFNTIYSAHLAAQKENITATDDIALILRRGGKVLASQGSDSNFKITTQEDYRLAHLLTKPTCKST